MRLADFGNSLVNTSVDDVPMENQPHPIIEVQRHTGEEKSRELTNCATRGIRSDGQFNRTRCHEVTIQTVVQ